MEVEPVTLLLRWAHILAAVVALGGLLFSRFAVLPAAEDLPEAERERLHEGVRRRWLPWVIGAITLLLASGVANYVLLIRRVKDAPELWPADWMARTGYHQLFGVKFALAMVVFFLASGLVGRGAATRWIREGRRTWLSVAAGLGVAAVLLSGWMRQLHTGANDMPGPVREYARTYLDDLQQANAVGGDDDDGGSRGTGGPAGRPGNERPAPGEARDGQETEEAAGGAAAEDREAAAAPGGGEEAAR